MKKIAKKIYRAVPLENNKLQIELYLPKSKGKLVTHIFELSYKNMDAEFRSTIPEIQFTEAFLDYKLESLHWRKTENYFISRDINFLEKEII